MVLMCDFCFYPHRYQIVLMFSVVQIFQTNHDVEQLYSDADNPLQPKHILMAQLQDNLSNQVQKYEPQLQWFMITILPILSLTTFKQSDFPSLSIISSTGIRTHQQEVYNM